jgi:2-polyprenyl-6-methoxyphenol hydroxylase-like FAD-dependent oxidoreductase
MLENSIPPKSDVPVIIVGAGPVGLTLAAGLAKQGIRSIVIEKKPKLDEHSRALAVQASTLELLSSYGMADEFMQAGCFLRHINFA